MTWDEFKVHIDYELILKGISGDVDIAYIDISLPRDGDFNVSADMDCLSINDKD